MSPWPYINAILGPGLHWGKTSQELQAAIKRAELDGQMAAAEHLRIILGMRNQVAFDGSEKNPPV
ncbi:hypothetical protein UFOVP37_26 [uncultured Caudovirales phage]|uniref:Uncharacterized protein n=1 Tax=uncultured Caudovirales phage TaxID=2100421 RepID=A0A6J5KMR5_9CAUD|nr:hypothetical protein UFOVP37_26 [uncultured Caudovirales phage]